jgi:molybdate transport system substrate-binding protein
LFKLSLAVVLAIYSGSLFPAEIRVAAASNFSSAMKEIVEQFERTTDHQVKLSSGSTGKHYAQIINGAPFDAFFAADARRPELLVESGRAIEESRFTYALGRLVLWSPQAGYVDSQGEVLKQGEFRYLSVANPKLAPYGVAAQEVLQALGLWEQLSRRLVRGENIGQTYQFVRSGNAQLGFVARSQLISTDHAAGGSYWEPPQTLYTPIEQQAVKLTDNEAVGALMSFVRSETGIKIIREYGYDTP